VGCNAEWCYPCPRGGFACISASVVSCTSRSMYVLQYHLQPRYRLSCRWESEVKYSSQDHNTPGYSSPGACRPLAVTCNSKPSDQHHPDDKLQPPHNVDHSFSQAFDRIIITAHIHLHRPLRLRHPRTTHRPSDRQPPPQSSSASRLLQPQSRRSRREQRCASSPNTRPRGHQRA
jgi:hypothetical protein